MYNTGKELLQKCNELKLPISEIVILDEIENTGHKREDIIERMEEVLSVMHNSIENYENNTFKTMGNIIGGEAKKLNSYIKTNKSICGEAINKAMIRALACSEHNASMGKICAAPTAGSSGIIPATLITVYEEQNLSHDKLVKGLITSAGIGKIITQNATVAGAEGGCQAECGSAAAMAAAAVVEMLGGTPEMSLIAATISLKNIMGLICDPVAGLVEAPCSKRNSSGAVNAMTSAELALAGIQSVVTFDETVEAMYSVGIAMHPDFKETAKGGIAASKTAKEIEKRVLG
jgi:L-serine dehydratase